MKKLDLAPGFAPPIDLMVQKIAVLARTGAGKTNTAVVFAEEVLDARQQVVVLDPKGDWYGLRSSADGKSAGYPITVLGGDHGDLPLEPTGGAVIADVAAEGVSMVIDLSSFAGGEMRRFVTDFAERFYRAKKDHVSPVLLIVEEADEVVPQRFTGEYARMVGPMERIVKRARFRGVGSMLVTQRSASLNKDVLTQTEVLIVQQTTSPQDKKAIDAWVESHPDQEKRAELMANIASLKKGEAFVWSPTFLETFRRVRFRMRRTYDAGRDVKIGELRAAPKVLAPVDLAALGERMKATVERQKADDPKALRAKIRELEQQVRAKPVAAMPTPTRVEVAVLRNGTTKALSKAASAMVHVADRFGAAADNLDGVTNRVLEAAKELRAAAAPIVFELARIQSTPSGGAAAEGSATATPVRAGPVPVGSAMTRGQPGERSSPTSVLTRPLTTKTPGPARAEGAPRRYLQKVLDAVASLHALGYPRPSLLAIATWSKMSVRGGAFIGYLRELAAAGMVEKSGGEAWLTTAGQEAANPRTAMTTADVHALAHEIARPYLHKILDPLLYVYPDALELGDLALRAGMSVEGGAFAGYVRELRAYGFVTTTRGSARATDVLFPEGLS